MKAKSICLSTLQKVQISHKRFVENKVRDYIYIHTHTIYIYIPHPHLIRAKILNSTLSEFRTASSYITLPVSAKTILPSKVKF